LGEGHRQASTGGRVIYFYSNGSATPNRGAEVCKSRALNLAMLQFSLLQVIHQLHRAVLDCGIESYIEKVNSIEFYLSIYILCPPLICIPAISAVL
jgi:hypothetical protein